MFEVGRTNLQLHERLMNFPAVLRQVLRPIWENDFHD